MKSIIDSWFLTSSMEACHYFWQAGWGEFHAGNLSLLLTDEDLDEFSEELAVTRTIPVNFNTFGLVGKTLLVTRSGAVFRNSLKKPHRDFGIIKINDKSIDVLWGLEQGGGPTSELPTHLQCHASRLRQDEGHRIVLHCHPTYTIAMSFAHELDEDRFTEMLWSLNSECVLVFPEGVGLLPWMVCGNGPIGEETARKMLAFRAVIWPYHGIFVSGNGFDEAIGLIETIEKNAQVYMLNQGRFTQRITPSQIHELAEAFNLKIRE